jgi:hypothetical protein
MFAQQKAGIYRNFLSLDPVRNVMRGSSARAEQLRSPAPVDSHALK